MWLITVLNVCLLISLIDAAYQPPEFSDEPDQYEDKSDDYYDLKNYDYLRNEEKLYQKTRPGGLVKGEAKNSGKKAGKPKGPVNPEGPKPNKKNKKNKKNRKNKKGKKNQKADHQQGNGPNASTPQNPRLAHGPGSPKYQTITEHVPARQGQPEKMMQISTRIDDLIRNSRYRQQPTITITRKKRVDGQWVDM
uniref:Hypothetical secreted protein n=1 Tax=Simulium vittatum TaxID=7192 RepID=B5M0M5_SIMVI|nr:hypothetical secreted protein [Simulium vittatum]